MYVEFLEENQPKKIQDYENYLIFPSGMILNKQKKEVAQFYFRHKFFVRLYKNGKRNVISVDKLLKENFSYPYPQLELYAGEILFQYKNTPYYITNRCRVYNRKTENWIKIIYRNNCPYFNCSYDGKRESVAILKYLRNKKEDLNLAMDIISSLGSHKMFEYWQFDKDRFYKEYMFVELHNNKVNIIEKKTGDLYSFLKTYNFRIYKTIPTDKEVITIKKIATIGKFDIVRKI